MTMSRFTMFCDYPVHPHLHPTRPWWLQIIVRQATNLGGLGEIVIMYRWERTDGRLTRDVSEIEQGGEISLPNGLQFHTHPEEPRGSTSWMNSGIVGYTETINRELAYIDTEFPLAPPPPLTSQVWRIWHDPVSSSGAVWRTVHVVGVDIFNNGGTEYVFPREKGQLSRVHLSLPVIWASDEGEPYPTKDQTHTLSAAQWRSLVSLPTTSMVRGPSIYGMNVPWAPWNWTGQDLTPPGETKP